jgi:hypothetical protein
MNIGASLRNLKRRYLYKKAVWMSKGQRVTQMQLFYWGSIICGVSGFLYAISCIFTGLPYWHSILPVLLLLSYFPLVIIKKNFRAMAVYIFHPKRGRLLLYLNRPIIINGIRHYRPSHFSEEHKSRLLRWVYLSKNTVRKERWLFLGNKEKEGGKLTESEKKERGCKSVTCPQQLLDGFNKSILVDALIYAHKNIKPLDDNLREIMELTDENMDKFNIAVEIDRCRTDNRSPKVKKYEEIGMKIIKNRKK